MDHITSVDFDTCTVSYILHAKDGVFKAKLHGIEKNLSKEECKCAFEDILHNSRALLIIENGFAIEVVGDKIKIETETISQNIISWNDVINKNLDHLCKPSEWEYKLFKDKYVNTQQ